MALDFEGEVQAAVSSSQKDNESGHKVELELNLLLQGLIELSAIMDQSLDRLQTQKRILFLIYEAQLALKDIHSESQRLRAFAHYFFQTKSFRLIDPTLVSQFSMRAFQVHHLLAKKWASPLITRSFFIGLGQQLGLNLSALRIKDQELCKWYASGEKMIIDLRRQGECLDADQIVELTSENRNADGAPWDSVTDEELIFELISAVKTQLQQYPAQGLLKKLQQMQIVLRPQSIELLAERALISLKLGDEVGALRDLKKFFSHHHKSQTSESLLEIYNDLNKKHPQVTIFEN